MPDLHDLLDAYVGDGTLPGAVGWWRAETTPRWR